MKKFKKLSSLFLALMMVASVLTAVPFSASAAVWNGKASSSFAGGKGTKSSPYIIKTGEQLARMRNLVNSTKSGNYKYRSAYYKLGADITLNSNSSNYAKWGSSAPSRKWTPIGTSYFCGSFDGNGYSISGVYVNTSSNHVGLFSYIMDGDIKNLTVKNSYIKSTYDYGYAGGIAAYVYGSSDNYANIIGCKCYSSVISAHHAGGIAGQGSTYTNLYNCSNSANVSGESDVGGVCGSFSIYSGKFYSNTNSGSVSGEDDVGGVCGSIYSSNKSATVYNCINKGTVSGNGYYAGGVFGYVCALSSSLTVTKISNSASVSGKSSTGGLIGYVSKSDGYSFSLTQSAVYDGVNVTSSYNGGGLVGYISCSSGNGTVYVKNCCVGTGSVTSSSNAGGLVGGVSVYENSAAVISNNVTKAKPYAKDSYSSAGGLIGDVANYSKLTVSKNASTAAPYASSSGNKGYIIGYYMGVVPDSGSVSAVIENNYRTYSLSSPCGHTSSSSGYKVPTYSNNNYVSASQLYGESNGNSKLSIYRCAWNFSSSALPSVNISASHSYNTSIKKAEYTKNGSKNGSVTKTCKYCGNKSVTTIYKIKTVKLSKTKYKYNKKQKTPSVTVKDSKGKTLKKGTDYTVSYPKNRKKVGTYTVKVTFKGNYKGSATLKFKIAK